MATDSDIEEWLSGEGIADRAGRAEAMAVLAAAGLTRAGKQRIADYKLDRAREALWAGITPVCSDAGCRASVAPQAGKPLVTTTRERCAVCGGSNTRRGLRAMRDACEAAGLRRILLVGGSRAAHVELREALADSAIELRVVDGLNDSPTRRSAAPDMEWAQLMVIWASTQLPHKVSQAYTEGRPRGLPMITVARRGVEALAQEVARFARGGGGR